MAPRALNGRCVIKLQVISSGRTQSLFFSFQTPLALFKSRALHSRLHQSSFQTEPRGTPRWEPDKPHVGNSGPLIFNTLPNIRPAAGHFSGILKKREVLDLSFDELHQFMILIFIHIFFLHKTKENRIH